jgi:hypothetical protein
MWNNAILPRLSQLSYLLSHYPILPDKNDKSHIFLSQYINFLLQYIYFQEYIYFCIVEEFIIILLAIIILF